ncbi:MAG: hypothetical protein ACT4QC_21735 [Planctomycetaceae bacterium]
MKAALKFDRWVLGSVRRLIVFIFVAALCGCDGPDERVVETAREAAAVRQSAEDALKAQGARVTSERLPVVGIYASVVDLSGVKDITDETLTQLRQMQTADRPTSKINLSGTNISDEQLAQLSDKYLSGGVTKLDLRNTAISDAGLQAIAGMISLTDLDVTNTKVTAEGIQTFLKARADNPEVQSKKPKVRR